MTILDRNNEGGLCPDGLSLIRLSFSRIEPDFLDLLGRTIYRLPGFFNIPMMPTVSTMGGIRGILYWTSISERARIIGIEVPCHPHADHFPKSFEGSRLHTRRR